LIRENSKLFHLGVQSTFKLDQQECACVKIRFRLFKRPPKCRGAPTRAMVLMASSSPKNIGGGIVTMKNEFLQGGGTVNMKGALKLEGLTPG